jgi:lariat debranching enzyme
VFDISAPEDHNPPKFTFDTEWLAITRAFHPWLTTSRQQKPIPSPQTMQKKIEEELEWVKVNVQGGTDTPKDIGDVQHFIMTSPGPIPNFKGNRFPARK